MRNLALAIAITLLLAFSACGDGGKPAPTPTATGVAVTPTETAALAASPVALGPGVTDTQITLGRYANLSEEGTGQLQDDALGAYFRYVNEELGGVCGREIVLKTYDDEGSDATALEVARTLVDEDEVLSIVYSGRSAVEEYLNERGVPDLLSLNEAAEFGRQPERYPWTTQLVPSLYTEARDFGAYMAGDWLPSGNTVAVLYPEDDRGREGLQGLEDGLDPSLNQLVAAEAVDPAATDIAAQVDRLAKSDADVLYLLTSPSQTGQALEQAQSIGWHPAKYTHGPPDPILFNYVSGEAVVPLSTFYSLMMPDWNPSEPAVAQHHRIMAEYGGPAPSALTVLSQVAGEIVVETLSRSCDNLTREGIMRANLSFRSCPKWRPSLLYYGLTVETSDADHRFLEGGFPMQVVFDQYQPAWAPLIRSGQYETERSAAGQYVNMWTPCDAWTVCDDPLVEQNTMTLTFGEVGVAFGEGHLLMSCNVLPRCGPNRISIDASYSGAFLPDSNEFAGFFSTRTVGYYFELGPDGACLTRVWSDDWGGLGSGSPQWRATLEDGVVRGFHVEEGQPPGRTFELILSGE